MRLSFGVYSLDPVSGNPHRECMGVHWLCVCVICRYLRFMGGLTFGLIVLSCRLIVDVLQYFKLFSPNSSFKVDGLPVIQCYDGFTRDENVKKDAKDSVTDCPQDHGNQCGRSTVPDAGRPFCLFLGFEVSGCFLNSA